MSYDQTNMELQFNLLPNWANNRWSNAANKQSHALQPNILLNKQELVSKFIQPTIPVESNQTAIAANQSITWKIENYKQRMDLQGKVQWKRLQ